MYKKYLLFSLLYFLNLKLKKCYTNLIIFLQIILFLFFYMVGI